VPKNNSGTMQNKIKFLSGMPKMLYGDMHEGRLN